MSFGYILNYTSLAKLTLFDWKSLLFLTIYMKILNLNYTK